MNYNGQDTRIEIWIMVRADEWARHYAHVDADLRKFFTLADCIEMHEDWEKQHEF